MRRSEARNRHAGGHAHSHRLVDRSIVRSRGGVRTVAISLAVLGVAAGAQVVVFVATNSAALLADLIHTFGDVLPGAHPAEGLAKAQASEMERADREVSGFLGISAIPKRATPPIPLAPARLG